MPNNQTKPNQTQTTPVARAGGIQRQRVEPHNWKPTPDEQPAFSERRAREFEWAAKHLPAEHPGMVVSALIGLEVAGQKQTTGTVMARLEGQGRTAAQMKAKGWL